MIAQEDLDRIVSDEVQRLWTMFSGQIATVDRRSTFRDRLVAAVGTVVEGPVEISVVDQGSGRWAVKAVPLPTPAEIEIREKTSAEALEASRLAKIEADKRRAAAHPTRAAVWRSGDEVYVSIDGMIADLQHWRLPPELWGDEELGFRRALGDVFHYLETRRKRA